MYHTLQDSGDSAHHKCNAEDCCPPRVWQVQEGIERWLCMEANTKCDIQSDTFDQTFDPASTVGSVRSTLPSRHVKALKRHLHTGRKLTTGSRTLSAGGTCKASVRAHYQPPIGSLFGPSYKTETCSRSSVEVSLQISCSGCYYGCLGIEQAVQIHLGVRLGLDHGEQQYL